MALLPSIKLLLYIKVALVFGASNWDDWWTYHGITGPDFWGVVNPKWEMCGKGRRQSPVNIESSKLVYDPHLRHIHIDKRRISGTLFNKGQSVVFKVDNGTKDYVSVTGGPLLYKYTLEELYIHFGLNNNDGSEHLINGHQFPAEIQLYGYNSQLYTSLEDAALGSNGIVGISMMVQVSDRGNDELHIISSGFSKVMFRGDSWRIRHISVAEMMPNTPHFMTYDGSTTYPGCWETTTWIIMNKPVYITKQELYSLRQLMQGEKTLPKTKMASNFRPVRDLFHRTVRTNIDFTNAHRGKGCPSMHKDMFYAARQWPKL